MITCQVRTTNGQHLVLAVITRGQENHAELASYVERWRPLRAATRVAAVCHILRPLIVRPPVAP